MATKIPQRELRNNVSEVLRRAESGTRFTITVNGRPVAELGPLEQAERLPSGRRLRALLADTPVDDGWSGDLTRQRDAERTGARDPWAD